MLNLLRSSFIQIVLAYYVSFVVVLDALLDRPDFSFL